MRPRNYKKLSKILQPHWTAWFWQFLGYFVAPLQLLDIFFLGWLCMLCVVILNNIILYYQTISFSPPLLMKVTFTEKCKIVNVPQQFWISFTWLFLTCVSQIFDLRGNIKYDCLCFGPTLPLQTGETQWRGSGDHLALRFNCVALPCTGTQTQDQPRRSTRIKKVPSFFTQNVSFIHRLCCTKETTLVKDKTLSTVLVIV